MLYDIQSKSIVCFSSLLTNIELTSTNKSAVRISFRKKIDINLINVGLNTGPEECLIEGVKGVGGRVAAAARLCSASCANVQCARRRRVT